MLQAVETRRLVYCLFMPGWTLTWFNNDFWSIMKEPEGPHEGIMGCNYKITLLLFLESHLKGGIEPWPPTVYMNSTQWDVTGLRVKKKKKHSVDTQCYDNFCFLPF